jgi:hypothetical protein
MSSSGQSDSVYPSYPFHPINYPTLSASSKVTLGIDPGIRTLTFCLLDDGHRIVALAQDDFAAGVNLKQLTRERLYELLHRYLDRPRIRQLWNLATHFVIEQQRTTKYIAIEGFLAAYFRPHGKVVVVPPIAWRKWFNVSTGGYGTNKRASVDLCRSIIVQVRGPPALVHARAEEGRLLRGHPDRGVRHVEAGGGTEPVALPRAGI